MDMDPPPLPDELEGSLVEYSKEYLIYLVSDISIATAASDATDSDVDLDARMASDDHLDVGL